MTRQETRAARSQPPGGADTGYFAEPPLITVAAFDALAPEWQSLHESLPERPPYSHPRWFSVWLGHFQPAGDPVFLAVRRGDRLVGVIPLDLRPGGATLLGDPNVSDFAGICVAPGEEEAAASALIEWLIEDFTGRLTVWGLRAGSPLLLAFHTAAERFGWALAETREAVSPAMPLAGDWEGYLATLGKKHRHELRRKLRNLEAAGEVALAGTASPGDVSEAMEGLLAQMRASREDKARFLTPPMEAFFRDLAPAFAEDGLARIWTLTLDGQSIATVFTFEDPGCVYLYNSGFVPTRSDLAPGLLSKALVIREAIAAGKSRFDFLRGDERYKRHLGGRERDVLAVTLSAPGTGDLP